MIAAFSAMSFIVMVLVVMVMRFELRLRAVNDRINQMATSFERSNIRAANYGAYQNGLHKSAVQRMDSLDEKLTAVVDSIGKRFEITPYKPEENPRIVLVPKGKKMRKVVDTAHEQMLRGQQEYMYRNYHP